MNITEAIARHVMEVYDGNWTDINLDDVACRCKLGEQQEKSAGVW